jgi:hypothetical protein
LLLLGVDDVIVAEADAESKGDDDEEEEEEEASKGSTSIFDEGLGTEGKDSTRFKNKKYKKHSDIQNKR